MIPEGKNIVYIFLALLCCFVVWISGFWISTLGKIRIRSKSEIRVGVLLNHFGDTPAVLEGPIAKAIELAINEINQSGGINGQRIVSIYPDEPILSSARGASIAESMAEDKKVCVFFGCSTTEIRQAVAGVVSAHELLLFHPFPYEGLERCKDIFYMGATPNQYIFPLMTWAMERYGRRILPVISNTVRSHVIEQLSRKVVEALHGEFIDLIIAPEEDELSVPFIQSQIRKIIELDPDFIFEDLLGTSEKYALYQGLREAGIRAEKMPILSVTLWEREVQLLSLETTLGHYCSWPTFRKHGQSSTKIFKQIYQSAYGEDSSTSPTMEAAYASVHIWANAARIAGTTNPPEVRKVLLNQSLNTPLGVIFIDPDSQHAYKDNWIGRVSKDGYQLIWSSRPDIIPQPFSMVSQFSETSEQEGKNIVEIAKARKQSDLNKQHPVP